MFDDEYHFRIKFEAIAPLVEDLEWKLIYVGSAKSEEYDQELDSCMVGPVPAGINAFDFQAPAPAHHLLPSQEHDEILGVTVIIITASYRDKEFVRVGYYVNTYYEEEAYKENPPASVDWAKLHRNVLIEKPKVTRFQNPWDSALASFGGAQEQQQQLQLQQQQQQQQQQEMSFGGSSSGMSSEMLFSAPLPAPVVKAESAFGGGGQGGGMEVDAA
ncbi:histone binding protein [Dioszegia hungarica]|uniref:Anti-silencing function protein 1 n=1 Tax=Dioszegia hungarica TaxID=4972 RepID=A0AA38HGB7_9TREE|nr:histone binding protein [Dioszegia hungarica]KAI9639618.1 histone binding protein [Dioszegia hungarica]